MMETLRNITDNPLSLFTVLFLLAVINLYFPPVPLETLTLFAGFLSGTGYGSIIIIITATAAGMSCGSILLYYYVRARGLAFLQRTPFRKFTAGPSYHQAVAWFRRYGIYTVFLGKLVPGMSLATVICCGVFDWKFRTAVGAICGSNLLFFGVLAISGRFLGVSWGHALPWLSKISAGAMVVFIIWLIVRTVIFLRRRHREKV